MTHIPELQIAAPDPDTLSWNEGGLIPCAVQDADSGQLLMLAYMNREALRETVERGKLTFYSRSRQALWRKGETSGNVLELVRLGADCDADTLLAHARPRGPACHRGTVSCWDLPAPPLAPLGRLTRTVRERAGADPESSYTARLLHGGVRRCAQKVGEEGVEVALAGVAQSERALLEESADLLYHLTVLLRARGLGLEDAVSVLAQRAR